MSYLKENPDRVIEQGVQVAGWSDDDSVCFFIEDGASYWGRNDIHPLLVLAIAEADDLEEFLKEGDGYRAAASTPEKFQAFREKIRAEMAKTAKTSLKNDTSQRFWGELSGRIWTDKGVISFWETAWGIHNQFPAIDRMIQGITGFKIDDTWRFEVLDQSGKLLTWKEILSLRAGAPVDPEKLRVQHTDPEVKRELNLPNAGSIAVARKADDAGISAAEFMFKNRIGDSLRTHPDLLLEDPDTVKVNGEVVANYDLDDAITFSIINGWFFGSGRHYHGTLAHALKHAEGIDDLLSREILIDPELTNEEFYFELMPILWPAGHDFEPRVSPDVCGRLWTGLISFWNSREEVTAHLDSVARMLQVLGLDIRQFRFEFLPEQGKLFPYGELHNREESPKLSPEEMNKLRAVQHVDPKAKAALGKEAAGSIKRGDVAQKAGFRIPAEIAFNQQQSESLLPPPPSH